MPRLPPMIALYATIALSTVTIGVSTTLLPLYVLSLGGSPADWGLLYACFALAMGFGEVTIGVLSDRFGIRRAMALSRALSGLVTVWLALLPGLGALYLVQALRGAADSAIWPLGKSHIGRTVAIHSKATHLGLFTMMAGLGSSVGAAAGGIVLEAYGFSPAFFIATVASLIAAGVAWAGLSEAPQHRVTPQVRRQPSAQRGPGLARARNHRAGPSEAGTGYLSRFVPIAMVTLVLVAGWAAATSTLPVIASQSAGLGPAEVGFLVSGFGLTTTLLALPLGRLADRFGRRATLLAGLIAMALSVFGFALFDTFITLMSAVVINAVGWSLANPAKAALLSDITPVNRQGTAMGWIGAVEDAGMAAGGGLAGLLLAAYGRSSTFAVVGAMLLLGILVCAVTIREREWRARLAQPQTHSAGTSA